MNILEQYAEKINGEFSFFDRIIIKGHIRQFFSPSGKKHFMSVNDVLLKDFAIYAQKVTDELCEHIEKYIKELNRPYIYLYEAKTSKEETAMKLLNESPIESGLIGGIGVVENCSTLKAIPDKKTNLLYLGNVARKCKYYYLYYLDEEFGFMHVKIQTWFPFQMQVYINGRQLMKNVFDKHDITYQMYDNSFVYISDTQKAQELADKFDSKKLCNRLDAFATRINPFMDTIYNTFHQGYLWCIDQCEYATDVMFKSREDLEDIYPSLVEHAFFDFKCEDIFSFMGRKLDQKFQGELVSDYRKRPEGFRIKHRMKSNSIKMYDKFSVLRIEMTINDPKEFKTRKEVHHKDGTSSMQWSPMGKSISNLYRYAQISKASNKRYITALNNIIPKESTDKEISEICGKVENKKRIFTGFNVWEYSTFALFCELANAAYLIRGFTNLDIRNALYKSNVANDTYVRNRMTRTFAKLRAHGLIRKVPHSLRYFVTDKGRRVMSALIQTRKSLYPKFAAG